MKINYQSIRENMKYYYHITPKENLELIKSKGIKNSGDGIFLIDTDDMFVIQHISFNQIFCDEIAVLKINVAGITGKLYPDDVAEMTSKHQFLTKQNKIKPEYIELHKEFKFKIDDMVDFLLIQYEKLLGFRMDRNQIKELIEYQLNEAKKNNDLVK